MLRSPGRITTVTRPLLAAALFLAPASSAQPPTDPALISQKARRFAPDAASVKVGQQLTVLNDDKFTHHLYYNDQGSKFDSGAQRPGETVKLKFAEAGFYEVHCAIHPKMRLDVTVEE